MTVSKLPSEMVSLEGLTLLVVEDETIISFLLEDMLADLGCKAVLHAGRVSDALEIIRKNKPDAAVLDVNLGGEHAYPVAAELAAAQVPFVFTTGYGASGIQAEWAKRPVIQKPFRLESLSEALGKAIAGRAPSA
jgi:DNA-binding NtrC family response regulator